MVRILLGTQFSGDAVSHFSTSGLADVIICELMSILSDSAIDSFATRESRSSWSSARAVLSFSIISISMFITLENQDIYIEEISYL